MFDITRRKYITNPKVKDLIAILEGESMDARLTVDGLEEFYIHVTDTNEHVAIDLDTLDSDCYYPQFVNSDQPDSLNPENFENQKPFIIDYGISRLECLELLSKVVENIPEDKLLEIGFTKENIKEIRS